MSDAQEREDLEALVASPGWLRVLQHARETWAGDGYARKLKLAIRTATEQGENVAEAVQRVDAANDEVNALLSWPSERVKSLRLREAARQEGESLLSRRGSL